MAFVQIIEYTSGQFDELRAVSDEWHEATEGKRTVRRSFLCRDRDQPNRYVTIVFFDSYEEAMANSQLPETDRLSGKIAELAEGAPSFSNLDVIEERT
jgi:quinol monooxygenase YgiN